MDNEIIALLREIRDELICLRAEINSSNHYTLNVNGPTDEMRKDFETLLKTAAGSQPGHEVNPPSPGK